eukprot:CAMPEP_0115005868 /NCGR_PEP_ID=MMETSP0216-20121206/20142_1 /TAXON_ID=223996 /ORGANISM="Protocruzia adherens, Strain Boccale" /LENGTH=280 /DNA_ID=CAMNT_0002372305 /DNA_START=61 /DNA_END=903 /DNA_ORIENTATION=+
MAAPIIATNEDVRAAWDAFSEAYELSSQPWTNLTDVELQYMSRLDSAKSVCVAGAGPGLGGLQIRQKVSQDCKVVVGDLSPEMVKLAELLFTKSGYSINNEESNTKVQVMDNQNLPVESDSCDRYVANLSIMLVPEPMKQLQEAYRVLQEGGLAVISTWGRPEFSTFFTLPGKVFKSMKIEKPAERSLFHLGQEVEMQAKFKEAGFRKVFTYYNTLRQTVYEHAKEYTNMLQTSPEFRITLKKLGERAEEFLNLLQEECQNLMDSGELLTFDNLVVVATK